MLQNVLYCIKFYANFNCASCREKIPLRLGVCPTHRMDDGQNGTIDTVIRRYSCIYACIQVTTDYANIPNSVQPKMRGNVQCCICVALLMVGQCSWFFYRRTTRFNLQMAKSQLCLVLLQYDLKQLAEGNPLLDTTMGEQVLGKSRMPELIAPYRILLPSPHLKAAS